MVIAKFLREASASVCSLLVPRLSDDQDRKELGTLKILQRKLSVCSSRMIFAMVILA